MASRDWSLGRRRLPEANVQVAQLLLADRSGRFGEQVGRGLGLWERDQLADAVRPRHQHRQAIEPEGDPAMGWCAETQRIEQKAELVARFLGVDAEQLEHRRLQLL